MFVENLPMESAYARSSLGPKATWGTPEDLLAHVAHLLEVGLWAQADAKKRGAMPQPLPSPWDEQPEQMSTEERVRRLLDLNDRDRQRRGLPA